MLFAAIRVSDEKRSLPITCICFIATETRGNLLINEISISAKSTFALIFLLISDLTILMILPLNKMGIAKRMAIITNSAMPVILRTFFIVMYFILFLPLLLSTNGYKHLVHNQLIK